MVVCYSLVLFCYCSVVAGLHVVGVVVVLISCERGWLFWYYWLDSGEGGCFCVVGFGFSQLLVGV